MGPGQFESWNGMSCHHAVTISVRDSAALLDATAGAELGSPYFSPLPSRPFLSELRQVPGKLRVALCVEGALDPACQKAVIDAAKLCEGLGHRVEEKKLPVDNAALRNARLTVIDVSLARVLADAEAKEPDVEPVTWSRAQAGKKIDAVSYGRAIAAMHQIGLTMARFQEEWDVILRPVLAKPPVELGVLSLSQVSMEAFGREIAAFSPYTGLENVTGQPAMSVPFDVTADGLPVGVMFSGRFGDEATLLRLAAQIEKARPWAGRRPPIS
jgi:amidase/6-aminohexanoate-cyclic-dimer hydrolase